MKKTDIERLGDYLILQNVTAFSSFNHMIPVQLVHFESYFFVGEVAGYVGILRP